MENTKEYWFCEIGPIDKKIPKTDWDLRQSVRDQFENDFPDEEDYTCSSGWGLTEEMKQRLSTIRHLPHLDCTGEILKTIDKELSKLSKRLIEREEKLKDEDR